ncbi:hypothetical protein Hanom_Chr03g00201841 [Helianthus anomalus]
MFHVIYTKTSSSYLRALVVPIYKTSKRSNIEFTLNSPKLTQPDFWKPFLTVNLNLSQLFIFTCS